MSWWILSTIITGAAIIVVAVVAIVMARYRL